MIKTGTLCNENNYGTEKQREQEKVKHETSCYIMALLIVFHLFKYLKYSGKSTGKQKLFIRHIKGR